MKLKIFYIVLSASVFFGYAAMYADSDSRTTREVAIDIQTTLTTCCAEINQNFSTTFTTLAALETALQEQGCASQFIAQANVGTTGFVITSSGSYKLSQNIIFSPASSAAAITITADNVILDLQCFSITQGNATANVDGISVASNVSTVVIENGKLQNFSRDGIRVGSGCSSIVYENTTIQSCEYGIYCLGTVNSPISDLQTIGLDLISNDTGVSLNFVNRAVVSSCNFFGNAYAGVELVSSFSNAIESCTIENTGAATGSAFGVSLINGGNNRVQECYIDGVSTSDTFSGNSAVGILIGATENDDVITDNQISNCTTTSNAQPFGIEMLYTFTSLNQLTEIVYSGGSSTVLEVEWSPNGRYLAVSNSSDLFIYEYANKVLKQTQTLTLTFVTGLAWSLDGSYLAVGNNVSFNIYLVDQGLLELVTHVASGINEVAWSPDGKYLAIGGTTDFLTVYAFSNNTLFQVAQISAVDQMQFLQWSPDGSYIAATLLNTSEVQIYKFTGNLLQLVTSTTATIEGPSRWSPNGRYLAVTTSSAINIFSFSGTALQLIATISAATIGNTTLEAVLWSPDGQYLAVIAQGPTYTIIILKFEITALVVAMKQAVGGTTEFYQGFSWSPNGSVMAFGTNNNTLLLYSGFVFPYTSLIKNNELSFIQGPTLSSGQPGFSSGRGLSASSASNLIIQNTAFNGDINYVFVNNIFEQFESNASQRPSIISNVSFPPL